MEKCFEYFGCKKLDCVIFSRPEVYSCWEVGGTLCSHEGIELIAKIKGGHKIEACKSCAYYRASKDDFVRN